MCKIAVKWLYVAISQRTISCQFTAHSLIRVPTLLEEKIP